MAIPELKPFLQAVSQSKKDYLQGLTKVFALDPGETTGYCILDLTDMHEGVLGATQGQLDTSTLPVACKQLSNLFRKIGPATSWAIIIEDYRVFAWKKDSHSFSELHTAKVIGGLCWETTQRGLKYIMQTPQQAKNFVDNDKLKKWGFYHPTQRHAMDATRHALYYLTFGPSKKQS